MVLKVQNKKKKSGEKPFLKSLNPMVEGNEETQDMSIIFVHFLLGAFPNLNVEHALDEVNMMLCDPHGVSLEDIERLGRRLVKVSDGSKSLEYN